MASSDWANLPGLLLCQVLEKLASPRDFVRFSNVCLSWNAVAKDNKSKHTTPLLLIHSEDETWNLCDIKEDRVIEQLDLLENRFCGFSKGWLITIDYNFVVSLMHPFSRVKGRRNENSIIYLPPLKEPKTRERRNRWYNVATYYVFRAAISADPISNAKECIVAVIYDCAQYMAFIRLGKDAEWTYVDAAWYIIQDVIFYAQDKFYAIDDESKLFSIQVSDEFINSNDVILLAEDFKQDDSNNIVMDSTQDSLIIKRYLVEFSGNELLLIQRFYRYNTERRRETTKFEIFKLDHDNCEWIAVNTLDDEDSALFIGDNSSIPILTSSKLIGLPTNCIYFTDDWDGHSSSKNDGSDYGIYSIRSGSLLPIDNTHVATLLKKVTSRLSPIWTVANIKL